jgi:hypothetical protein
MGPQNGIIGDNYGIDLPSLQVDKDVLAEERAKARFSKSKEFKRLKDQMEARIEFYQRALPDGRPLTAVDAAERGNMWVIANAVIGEFNMLIADYENAAEVTKNG